MNLEQGQELHGFTVLTAEPLPEIDGDAYTLSHPASGAKLLYLRNDDRNKAFSIAFRTPPADDTGVFHILEHSVLCGSEKFPVKEPFVNLLGATDTILPYAKETGLDAIEAVTPKPQGDVTVEEIKAAFGDQVGLVDGIAALLFDEMYPLEMLKQQTEQLIDLFAGKLILGISDEMSSTGNIDRVKYVGEIVDRHNASC